jgi:ABC-type amino acid transport substrate-binding protein
MTGKNDARSMMHGECRDRGKAMKRITLVLLLALGFWGMAGSGGAAERTLDKITSSGKMVVGARSGSVPFGFIDRNNTWVGFSVDLCTEVKNKLEGKIGKKIDLELKEVIPSNRIALVANGTIDLECGSTTYTRARDETVDFSINFFFTGSQLLVKSESGIKSVTDLTGKRVGATQGTTNEKAIREVAPKAQVVVFQDHPSGFLALEQGKIDAYTTDGIILAGLRAKSPNAAGYEVVGDFFTNEPYSFILRENDSPWRDFVNHALMAMIEDGTYFKLYDKWFGPEGAVPYPMPAAVRTYLTMQVMPK